MSDLSHVDVSQAFMPRDEGYEAGEPTPNLEKRKPERIGKPRAAREADLEARLYAIGRAAVVDFQEGR